MIKTIGFTISYFIVAFIIGNILKRSLDKKNKDLFEVCIYGVLLEFFIFEVTVCIMAYLGRSLTDITRVYLYLLGIAAGIGMLIGIFNYKSQKRTDNGKNINAGNKISNNKIRKKTSFFENAKKGKVSSIAINIGMLLLIAVQIYLSTKYIFLHKEDAFYTGSTTTSLVTDSVLKYSPYTGEPISITNHKADLVASLPYYFAVLAKILNVTGAYANHIVVPCIFIIFGYMVYYEIAKLLFAEDAENNQIRNRQLFMFFIIIYNFFMGKSYAAGYEGLTTCVWHGGSFLYAISVPVLLYAIGKMFFEKNKRALILIVLSGVMCAMTIKNAGIATAVLVIITAMISRIIAGISGYIKRKKV